MATLSLTYTLTAGTPENVNQVQQNFTDIRTWLNGANIDTNNVSSTAGFTAAQLAAAAKDQVGLNDGTTVRRGKSIIPALESRTNVAYGLMTTPDRVQNVVLPTDGLICVAYKAIWRESVNAAASAAIFVGANQLKVPTTTAPVVQASVLAAGAPNIYNALTTYPGGLDSSAQATAHGSDITTGEAVAHIGGSVFLGGPCYIFAAAGTYDVSIQFKSTSGSIDVTERKLWVWTMGF